MDDGQNGEAMTPGGQPLSMADMVGFMMRDLFSHGINMEEHLDEAQRSAARLGYQNRNMRGELEALYRGALEKEGRIAELNSLLHEAWALLANGAADPSLPTPQHSVWPVRRTEWREKWFALNGVTAEEAYDTAQRYADQQHEGSPEGLMDRPDVLPTSAPSQA